MYYVSIMAEEVDYSLQEIAEININKLAKRYPEGFSVEASINRVDIQGETLGVHYKDYSKEIRKH